MNKIELLKRENKMLKDMVAKQEEETMLKRENKRLRMKYTFMPLVPLGNMMKGVGREIGKMTSKGVKKLEELDDRIKKEREMNTKQQRRKGRKDGSFADSTLNALP